MSRALPAAIQWHEGMLLAPQHLQQLTLRHESLLHYHALAIAPFHWGVRRLEVDGAMLIAGVYRATSLEAVLPDGLVVAYRAGDGPDLSVDLAPWVEEAKARPVTVYLAVPARRPDVSPVKGDLARFESIEGESVVDENTGDAEIDIPRLRPRACLLAGPRPPAKFASLPLARLAFTGGALAVTEYVPPLLEVALDSPLGARCAAVAQRLREKAVFLSTRVTDPSVAGRAPQLLETRAMIASLTSALPPFEALLASGRAHPFALYLALSAVVGQVAALGRGLLPPALEPYDHDDLAPRFETAREFLLGVVDAAVVESYTPFTFSLDGGVFSLAFDAAWRNRPLVLGLRAAQKVPERETAAWLEAAVIASRDRVAALRDRRVLGAPRRRIEGEGDLLPTSGTLLFALTAEPELVEANQLLQIVNPGEAAGASRPVEIVLYVKNRP